MRFVGIADLKKKSVTSDKYITSFMHILSKYKLISNQIKQKIQICDLAVFAGGFVFIHPQLKYSLTRCTKTADICTVVYIQSVRLS